MAITPRSQGTPSSRGTVVVIDDSATALSAVTRWLEQERLEVVALSRSLGATRVVMHVRPAVLLLDIELPGLSGDRFAKLLSQNPQTASVPIIFYSQIDPDRLKRLAQECAVVGAISKTGDRTAFVREFEKLAAPFLSTGTDAAPASGAPSSSRGPLDPPEVGVPELDEQHRRLMEMTRRLTALIRDPKSVESKPLVRRDLKDSALKLLVFMRFHFATEDRYMRDITHPTIEEHRAEHAKYLDQAVPVEAALVADASPAKLLEAARELRRLVLEHTWSTDINLGPEPA